MKQNVEEGKSFVSKAIKSKDIHSSLLKASRLRLSLCFRGFCPNLAGHPMRAFLAKAQRRGDNSQ